TLKCLHAYIPKIGKQKFNDCPLIAFGRDGLLKQSPFRVNQIIKVFPSSKRDIRKFSSTFSKEILPEVEENNNQVGAIIKPETLYDNIYTIKSLILKENKDKAGIYRFSNKLNGNFYIGSSINLSKRFSNYFNISYISKVKNDLTISRALVKYGDINFTLEILEYCEVISGYELLKREQFYLDLLKPAYNIEKIAGSSIGVVRSEETKDKISKSLKGVYTGEKSALFGKLHTEETKYLMSKLKVGNKNPLYGKSHTDATKALMSKAKLGKSHNDHTKEAISIAKGELRRLSIYMKQKTDGVLAETCKFTSAEQYNLTFIRKFHSVRDAGRYLNISHITASKYLKSGDFLNNTYKLSNIKLN
uniref:GIY-YIG endonuclease n=1 Tax=Ramaria cf. rubripermanens TaxID=2016387 RepID=UPI0022385A38